MIIKSVRLRNIRSYVDERIVFPEGTSLLAGEIGSGKSSVLLAIEFALFGITRGVLAGGSLLRLGEEEGFVEMGFLVDNKECIIKRCLKRSKEDVRQESGYIIVEDEKTEGTAIELKSRVLELMGYPRQLLTKSKSLIYRYTVYTPQEDMKKILLDENEARLDTLRRLFQIDRYKRIRENALVVIKELRLKQVSLKGQISDLEEKERLLSRMDEEIKRLEAELERVIPDANKAGKMVKEKREEINSKEEELKRLNLFRNEEAMIASQISEKARLVKTNGTEIEEIKRQVTSLQNRIAEFITGEKPDGNDNEKLIEEVEGKRLGLLKERAELEQEIRTHKRLIEEEKKGFDEISKLKKCPTCLQDVPPSHIHLVHEERKRKMEGLERALLECGTRLGPVNERHKALEERVLLLREQLKRENEYRMRLKERENLENLNKEKERNLLILESKQKELKKEIGLLNSKKIEIEASITGLQEVEKEGLVLKKEMEELLVVEKARLVELTKVNTERENFAKNRGLLLDEIDKKRRIREEIGVLTQKQNWLQQVFVNLMIRIERGVMVRVYNEFNEIFQQFFSMLLEETNISVNLNEEFTPVIEENGYEIEYTDLSGGEKTSIALAYRLALNKVVNDLIDNIKTKDLIILDEPTDGFSSEQLDKMRPLLESLNTRQTIIVSHESKMESLVERIIRVSKHEHISSVSGQ